METNADIVSPIKIINYYRNQINEMSYTLTVQTMINDQYRELIAQLVANHPELEQEVKNGSDSKQADTGRQQEQRKH